jgi:hypothetical protein
MRNSDLVYTLKLLEEKIKLLDNKIIDLELENYELRKRIDYIYKIPLNNKGEII